MNAGNDANRSFRRAKGSAARNARKNGKLSASVTSFFNSSSRRVTIGGNLSSFNESDGSLLDDSGHRHASPHSPSSQQPHASASRPSDPHRRRGAYAHRRTTTSGASKRGFDGDPVAQLQRSLKYLELPTALIPEVLKQKLRLDSRFFLLENSISMGTDHTGNIGKLFSNREVVRTSVSLWEEVVDCMKYQSRLATRNGIATRIWLVNEPPAGIAQKYTIGKGYSETEAEDLVDILQEIVPSSKECPLASRVRNLTKYLVKATEDFDKGKYVNLTICTRGLPTDKHGRSNSDSQEEFRQAILSLSRGSVPVKIIIRLTTDDDDICDYYNGWDTSIGDVDVLDDWFGESLEVYLHNPWYVTKDCH